MGEDKNPGRESKTLYLKLITCPSQSQIFTYGASPGPGNKQISAGGITNAEALLLEAVSKWYGGFRN